MMRLQLGELALILSTLLTVLAMLRAIEMHQAEHPQLRVNPDMALTPMPQISSDLGELDVPGEYAALHSQTAANNEGAQ